MVHGITEYQMREMNNSNISYRSIAVLLFTILLSSCLKETAVPIESTFTARCQTKVHNCHGWRGCMGYSRGFPARCDAKNDDRRRYPAW